MADASDAQNGEIFRLREENETLRKSLFEFQVEEVRATGYREVLDKIAKAGMVFLDAGAAGVYLIDREAREFVFESAVGGGGSGLVSTRMPLTQGVPGLVAASGEAQIVLRPSFEGVEIDIVRRVGWRPESVLCVPLFHGDLMIGVLGFYDKNSEDGFDYKDVETATTFASIAAEALWQAVSRNARLQKSKEGEPGTSAKGTLGLSERLLKVTQDLALSGPQELELCVNVMHALQDYVSQKGAHGKF